jgi:class 3 adenylate cyclase
LQQKIAAIAALGVTFTAFAQHDNLTWPFVTMNDFQQRSASTRSLSGSYYLELIPIVSEEDRGDWESYSLANKGWLDEGRTFQANNEKGLDTGYESNGEENSVIFPKISDDMVVPAAGPGPYFPIWQSSPVLPAPLDFVNYNFIKFPGYGQYFDRAAKTGQMQIGGLDTGPAGNVSHPELTTFFYANLFSFEAGEYVDYTGEPMSSVYVPVVDSFKDDRKTVAVLFSVIKWGAYFENMLNPNAQPVQVVLENTCDGPFTYEIRGPNVEYIGKGNLANKKYEDMSQVVDLDDADFVAEETTIALTLNQDLCQYTLTVYPTVEMDEHYNDVFPLAITCTVAAVFIFTAVVFVLYDMMVERRQRMVLDTAKRSTAIVSSIFPKKVRDQLMGAPVQGNASKLRNIASGDAGPGGHNEAAAPGAATDGPIADLFPECTVMFADIEGFTAWSSVREPSQVFTLLETIYAAFDRVATQRKVFKVETIGDCYLAVCGLPDPRKDHAVVMARFARDCITEHIAMSKQLELTLGPETGDLRIRVGLHSGPITAGVLRGERSRFQLFGDTVNTGARLESSGEGNRIHISEFTASLIKEAGHGNWLREREDAVQLKGKGAMKTYWVDPRSAARRHSGTGGASSSPDVTSSKTRAPVSQAGFDSSELRSQRLVSWNVGTYHRMDSF